MQVLRSLVRSRLHDLDIFFENVSTFNEISTFSNEKRVADGSPQILLSENEVNNSGFSQNVNKTNEISMFVFSVEISLKALTFAKKKEVCPVQARAIADRSRLRDSHSSITDPSCVCGRFVCDKFTFQ